MKENLSGFISRDYVIIALVQGQRSLRGMGHRHGRMYELIEAAQA